MILALLVLACGGGDPAPCPDADDDGWCDEDDCSDIAADVHPGQDEIWYTGLDNACDGGDDYDADGDGWETTAGGDGPDCDDTNAAIHPYATPVCGNGVDDDCRPAADCARYGEEPIDDAVSGVVVGGEPDTPLDIDGDGVLEWSFWTERGYIFVHGSVTGDVSLDAPIATIPLGLTLAVGNLGGVSGDDVAYVHYSTFSSELWAITDPEEDPSPDMVIEGTWDYVHVGDVTGDGVGDVLASLPSWTRNVQIFAGPAAGDRAETDADAVLLFAPDHDDAVGLDADAKGDLTGDGLVDVVCGARGIPELGSGNGTYDVVVFPGPATGTRYAVDQGGVGLPGQAMQLDQYPKGFLDAHEDLDHDGYDDLLVADIWAGNGTVYRMFPGPFDATRRAPTDAGGSLDVVAPLLVVGDVNGDSWVDLAGAVRSSSGEYGLGVFYGPLVGAVMDTDGPDWLGAGIGGVEYAVGVGDVDGDGADEVLEPDGNDVMASQRTLILPGVPSAAL